MKKAAIIVRGEDAFEAIKQVRSLGVLHIEHQEAPKGKDISALQEDLALLNSCLDVFSRAEALSENSKPEMPALKDWRFTAKHAASLWRRYDQLESFLHSINNTINEWERWGDFDPQEIYVLSQKGIFVRLYQIPVSQLKQLPDEAAVKIIFSSGGIAGCAVVSNKKIDIPFKEMALPKDSLLSMRERLAEDKKAMEGIRNEIKKIASYYSQFLDIKRNLEKEIEFQQALCGMGKEGAFSYITGYLPFDKVEELKKYSHQQRWGLLLTEPSNEDNAPVLLRNPKWVRLIDPVFKLMEVVPGYHELDVSPLFLLFLSLFFGMIIGDAGYGTVYFLLTFFAQCKFGNKAKDKGVFFLFYLFSFCAIVWGLLTGTVFGQQWYLAKGFKALVPLLNQTKFLMSFCFFLGALQLSLAHGWQLLMKLPSLKALADAGFICLLWAGFFLAKMFIVGDPFPSFGKWLIWLGCLLIIFFSYPPKLPLEKSISRGAFVSKGVGLFWKILVFHNNLQKNIFKSALKGIGLLALGLTGNFGDVVSYIRLFAVGLAGVAVSDSVNTLALGAGSNIVAQGAILFIGHTINIVLGPLSVLVHGIRLNVLEFSVLHGNVTWSGLAYKPLKS